MSTLRPMRRSSGRERCGMVQELVRSSQTRAVWFADHPRSPSAPPFLGSEAGPGLLVAADHPLPTWNDKSVGFGWSAASRGQGISFREGGADGGR
jgi:hypothetical protein